MNSANVATAAQGGSSQNALFPRQDSTGSPLTRAQNDNNGPFSGAKMASTARNQTIGGGGGAGGIGKQISNARNEDHQALVSNFATHHPLQSSN